MSDHLVLLVLRLLHRICLLLGGKLGELVDLLGEVRLCLLDRLGFLFSRLLLGGLCLCLCL